MAQAKEMLTLENSVKLAVLLGFFYNITTGIDSIKSDILLIKQGNIYEVQQLQYQITELKGCCDNRKTKQIVMNTHEAIMPSEIEYEK